MWKPKIEIPKLNFKKKNFWFSKILNYFLICQTGVSFDLHMINCVSSHSVCHRDFIIAPSINSDFLENLPLWCNNGALCSGRRFTMAIYNGAMQSHRANGESNGSIMHHTVYGVHRFTGGYILPLPLHTLIWCQFSLMKHVNQIYGFYMIIQR